MALFSSRVLRFLGTGTMDASRICPRQLFATEPHCLGIGDTILQRQSEKPHEGERVAERERALRLLRAYDPAPTAIIDSGGGYQGFWKAGEPVALNGDPSPIERRNLRIEADLQADACHNIDRLMRLPGTVNWPNEKKRKKGRTPALACVVDAEWSRTYRLSGRTASAAPRWSCAPRRTGCPAASSGPTAALSPPHPGLWRRGTSTDPAFGQFQRPHVQTRWAQVLLDSLAVLQAFPLNGQL